MTDRLPFVNAARIARATFARAAQADLTAKEHRVLEAVVSATALYSKIEDRCFLAGLAAHAHGVDRAEPWHLEKTRKALVRLRDAGLVGYEPPRGRPPGGAGPAYRVWLIVTEEPSPDTGCDTPKNTASAPAEIPDRNAASSRGKSSPFPLEIQPAHGGPTGKDSEETSDDDPPVEWLDREERRQVTAYEESTGKVAGQGLRTAMRAQATKDWHTDRALDHQPGTSHQRQPTADDFRASATALGRSRAGIARDAQEIRDEVRRDLTLARFPELEQVAVDGWTTATDELSVNGAPR